MASLLGWKDILRPIRDGYRHIFPSPDTGPSPEERARQRELDRSKGFAYFDTFDQLEAWSEADVDPIQRANTPLLQRSSQPFADKREGGKAAVMLCHDYSGNYHDYESSQQLGIDEERYTCEYLQYISTFIYFSHKLVCVPPPSWTNSLHRNGVLSLGTVLIEPHTKDADRLLLQSGADNIHFPTAKKLASIANYYGFDGWLVNLEKPFSPQTWNLRTLEAFLHQLREDLAPSRRLVWYDALTTENRVAYQNGLTLKNISFSRTCGSVLTNYSWNESDASSSKRLASEYDDLPTEHIYFGIDVWAQNKAPITRRRVTFPEKGGGGSRVGIAVEKLSEMKFSAGIFAPAWSFEHFSGEADRGRQVERSLWEGKALPGDVTCSCGDTEVWHPTSHGCAIARFAKQYPAGSENFFYTDFSRGFGRHGQVEKDRIYDGKEMHSQLDSQSILPHVSVPSARKEVENTGNTLSHKLEDLVGRTHLVIETHGTGLPEDEPNQIHEAQLALFKFNMPADGSLRLSVMFNHTLQTPGASVSFYSKFSNGTTRFYPCQGGVIECIIQPQNESSETFELEELGVQLVSPPLGSQPIRILEIQEIRIVHLTQQSVVHNLTIGNIRIIQSGSGESRHQRLRWTYLDQSKTENERLTSTSGIPYSNITGPFSYFTVRADGVDVGRVYALECVLPASLVKSSGDAGVQVEIIGVGFEGRELVRAMKLVTASL